MRGIDPADLAYVDKAGSTVAMTRLHARAPVGEPAVDDVPRNRGTVISMIGALTLDGLVAMMTVEGGRRGPVAAGDARARRVGLPSRTLRQASAEEAPVHQGAQRTTTP